MLTRWIVAIAFCCFLVGAVGWESIARADEVVLDDAGRVVVEVDAEGRETHFAYHLNGEVRRIVYPDGRVERFDEQGNPLDG